MIEIEIVSFVIELLHEPTYLLTTYVLNEIILIMISELLTHKAKLFLVSKYLFFSVLLMISLAGQLLSSSEACKKARRCCQITKLLVRKNLALKLTQILPSRKIGKKGCDFIVLKYVTSYNKT